ncbi:GIY-YIG nuclease family protein [Candidatus Poriferisodalis sp.]|uniref:GIY-YIG nuclease family protein n=1 Tax=Candidatus Poriferisodalis sp. TaxID=3101277 RepID=UPI003B01660F
MADTESESGSVPNQAVAEELKRMLEEDDSRLGEVYRLSNAGKTPEAIGEELGVTTHSFVYSYLSMSRALLEGEIAKAPTVARQNAARLRSVLKQDNLSPDARAVLEHNLNLLSAAASDDAASQEEIATAKQGSRDLEEVLKSTTVSGVYVYSFPTLLLHPRNEDTGQTLLKIGRGDDVEDRVFRQVKTAWPENPIMLRVYRPRDDTTKTVNIEKRIHSILSAASHDWDEGGSEWFLTSLVFLDEIASLMGLSILENKRFGSKT